MTAPKSIGKYQILDVSGRGGMGVVDLAHDPRLDRQVALKLLGEFNENAELRERFFREARQATSIRPTSRSRSM